MREVRCREVAHFHFEVTVDLKNYGVPQGVRRYFFPGETNAGRAPGGDTGWPSGRGRKNFCVPTIRW